MNTVNLAAALQRVVQEQPQAQALAFEGRDLTYQELWDLVRRWRAALAGAVGPGDRVLCLAPNQPDVVALYFATVALGAVFVPLNPQLMEHEVANAAVRAEPAAAVADRSLAPVLDRALAEVPSVRTGIYIGATLPGVDDGAPVGVQPDTPALLSFTSGSTGKPKGVLASHAAELASARQYHRLWRLTSRDSILIALPLAFVYGLTTGTLSGLLGGARILLERRFHPRSILERITMDRPTIFLGVPTMYTMMLQVGIAEPDAFDLSSLRIMITSGAPAQEATLQRFAAQFGAVPTNLYACSEVRPVLAVDASDRTLHGAGFCGNPIEGVDVGFVGVGLAEVAPGSVGELVVRSPTVMLGYWREAEETARVLSDGWFRTGDLARFDDDGWSIIGRNKELIIRSGINVAPGEVESVLARDPDVLEACVVGVPHDVYGEEIAAAVVPASSAGLDPRELVDRVGRNLASYKTPRIVRIVKELPRNPNGKIDRARIREMLRDEVR